MASLLICNGTDALTVSKRLGHSKVSTTIDIYSHAIKQADERAAESIADVILRRVQEKRQRLPGKGAVAAFFF